MSWNGDRSVIRVPNHADVIDRIAKFDSFQVGERLYSAELLVPQLIINTGQLITECASTPAMVLYWGVEASRARRYHAAVEASYRSWRDRTWMDCKGTVNDDGKRPTDAMCERLVRQHVDYGTWRGRLDDAQQASEHAEAVHEAFKVKARLVEVQERLLRDEAGGPYIIAEDPRQTVPRQPQAPQA